MLRTAVKKASFHLARARDSFEPIRIIYDGDFTSDWANFLNAGNSVYEALGKGVKDDPKSRQWLGGKKRERRTDHLLNYMHQARNAAEHGLNNLLELGPEPRGGDALAQFASGQWETKTNPEGLCAIGKNSEGTTIKIQFTPPDYRLMSVYDDRSDQWHAPPTTHLGKPLKSNTPIAVGRLWQKYLVRMIREADLLSSPTP